MLLSVSFSLFSNPVSRQFVFLVTKKNLLIRDQEHETDTFFVSHST